MKEEVQIWLRRIGNSESCPLLGRGSHLERGCLVWNYETNLRESREIVKRHKRTRVIREGTLVSVDLERNFLTGPMASEKQMCRSLRASLDITDSRAKGLSWHRLPTDHVFEPSGKGNGVLLETPQLNITFVGHLLVRLR